MITQLTPEQEALIPVYREKWLRIAFSTERIDRQKATEAIKTAYLAIGVKEPALLFFDSPYEGLNSVLKQIEIRSLGRRLQSEQLGRRLENRLSWLKFMPELYEQISVEIRLKLWRELEDVRLYELESALENKLREPGSLKSYFFRSKLSNCCWPRYDSVSDFCVSVLECKSSRVKWEARQQLDKHCSLLFPYEKVCFVCDRPTKLSFDSENLLHAEDEPAIQFADGYSLYFHHGGTPPKKSGKASPNQ
jgi:hypothetical protein